MEAFATGTLAGAGSFRCEGCGFKVALHELDEVPACPQCGGQKFKRASIFMSVRPGLMRRETDHPVTSEFDQASVTDVEPMPDWLDEARDALVTNGDYLAFEAEGRTRVVPLQHGWTRIGRSLSAHIRFDDPTVSRRHALLHRDGAGVRILDDRSLNGVFLNGERVDWHELEDGDQIAIGAFHLFFMSVRNRAQAGASSLKLAPGA